MCVCGLVCTVQLKTLQSTGVKNSVVVRVGVFNRAKERDGHNDEKGLQNV